MSQSTTIRGVASLINRVANTITQKYAHEGFQTQHLSVTENGTTGAIVQIRNTQGGLGGALKAAIGCATCATLTLLKDGNDVKVEVGAGRWLDKGVVLTISMFVLWPLALTSSVGFFKQGKLLKKIYSDTLTAFATR